MNQPNTAIVALNLACREWFVITERATKRYAPLNPHKHNPAPKPKPGQWPEAVEIPAKKGEREQG